MRLAPTLLLFLGACSAAPTGPANANSAAEPAVPRVADPVDVVPPDDRHSHANPAEVQVQHVSLDLGIDFDSQTISGTATLKVHRRVGRAPLRLDSAGLKIRSVASADGELRWRREDADRILGTSIRIELPRGVDQVTIDYSTSRRAEALQWLEPAQTEGHRPFLFTQGQPILTRTWIPLQDSPGVRVTWDAIITVDPDLGVVPVMSSVSREDLGDGRYRFEMDLPVPSYLIALAVGDLESREISPRCSVWAEPSVVDRAASEFADAERMIASCEQKYGPYRWTRQDMLVLPPAFPFGGMENPCLTFVTPTILTGDRSLVSLIAHELSHAWSGNLVTNATWSDFWLNEGFTVYLEQRIVEDLYGPERARMETILGMRQLARELRSLPDRDQRLRINLGGRNPDDAITSVPYDKGAAFLRRLEREVGRDRFDAFLAEWFNEHAFQSVTTYEFLDFLDERLPQVAEVVDLDRWVSGPGLPEDNIPIDSDAFARVDAARAGWLDGGDLAAIDTDSWATTHWMRFLSEMPRDLDAAGVAELDEAFSLTDSTNSEILAVWLQIAISAGYARANARVEDFLLHVGRRKFLTPLYTELVKSEEGRQRAMQIYTKARPRYHAVSRRTIDDLLEWEG